MYIDEVHESGESIWFKNTVEHPDGADRGGEATATHELQVHDDGTLIYSVEHNAPLDCVDWFADAVKPLGKSLQEVKQGLTEFLQKRQAELDLAKEFLARLDKCTELELCEADLGKDEEGNWEDEADVADLDDDSEDD